MKSHYPLIAMALVLTTLVWIYFYSIDQPFTDATETVGVAAFILGFLFLGRAFFRWILSKSPPRAIPRMKGKRRKVRRVR